MCTYPHFKSFLGGKKYTRETIKFGSKVQCKPEMSVSGGQIWVVEVARHQNVTYCCEPLSHVFSHFSRF